MGINSSSVTTTLNHKYILKKPYEVNRDMFGNLCFSIRYYAWAWWLLWGFVVVVVLRSKTSDNPFLSISHIDQSTFMVFGDTGISLFLHHQKVSQTKHATNRISTWEGAVLGTCGYCSKWWWWGRRRHFFPFKSVLSQKGQSKGTTL